VTDTTALKNYHSTEPGRLQADERDRRAGVAYELARTDPNYKSRSSGVRTSRDQQLPFALPHCRIHLRPEINGSINQRETVRAAKPRSSSRQPPRWTVTNRINANVQDATVIKNENTGYNWSVPHRSSVRLLQGIYGKTRL